MNSFDPQKAEALIREAANWTPHAPRVQREEPSSDFDAIRAALVKSFEQLPEKVEVPYAMTPEGQRWAQFKNVCEEKFWPKIDYAQIRNRAAFDRVALWDGKAPGPCAVGETGAGKTRAAWWALRRLFVTENRSFAWFPARRLCTEMQKFEDKDCADEFFRTYGQFRTLFVDDLEKINWQYQTHSEQLFAFFDWVYRSKRPCIVTTNKGRDWWTEKMGDAFARRLFDDAHFEVKFE